MIFSQFQLAFYAHNEAQVRAIKQRLGLLHAEWVEDIATGDVWVRGGPKETSVAHLRFCYKFPVEIEILTYLEGPHWHQDKLEFKTGRPFVSHIGFHLGETDVPPVFDPVPAQRMITQSHTNPYLIEQGRRYRYEIYDRNQPGMASAMGVDMKYIYRIERPKGGV